MLGVLLKKQMTEKLSYFKRDKKRIDIVGALLTLVMTAFIMYVVVEVFGAFVAKYLEIRLNGVRDVRARQYEIMTFVYEFVFAVDVIGGVVAIYRAIFESDDRMIIQTLPVKASDVLYSKIIFIYAKQVLSAFVILVPFVAVFASVTKQGAGYVVLGLLAAFIIPVMSLSVSSVLAMPYYYVKKFFSSKYVCLLVIVTLVLFALFYCYATVLDFLKTLMSTGEIKFFFSEKTMTTIISLTKNLVPANFIAAFTLKTDVWKNLGIIAAITVATGAIGILITSLLYNKAMKTRATAGAIMIFAKKSAARKLPPFLSFLKKEFNLVLFTPDYAVQYFTVAAIMPLMVYFCMGIGKNFLTSLVFVQSDFELAILLTVLFGALTNTFCATNVSRDGKSFYVEKTLPLSINEIMGAKIALSFAVAVLSVGIAATVLLAKKYVSAGEGVFVFFVGAMMALSQILYATRKDLNSPQFSLEEDNVVRESNNNVSIIVVLGLVSAMILGGVPFAVVVISGVKGKDMSWFTYVFVSVCAAAEFVGSLLYYLIGIKNRFDRVTEGD